MTEHPSVEKLREFSRGELDSAGVRAVVRHLLRGCQRCGALLAPEVKAMFGFPLAAAEVRAAEGAYDAALDSAATQTAAAAEVWEDLRETATAAGGVARDGNIGNAGRTAGPMRFETLLEHCLTVRYDDPVLMVDLARSAAFLADRLDPRRYGEKQVADLRCRAWTELANAYRVAGRLYEAEGALETAAECHVTGSADELLGARLLEIQASLDADRRSFPEAMAALDEVYAVHLRYGDRHLAGRVLLKKGLYAGYDCEPERAIGLLEEGLAMIDREREPELVFGALHNLAHSLIECGRFEEARELLRCNRLGDPRGRTTQLAVRWLEGRIEGGLGNLERAERLLAEVRRGFEELDLRYKAALAGLELAAVHLHQERPDVARARALEAIEVFSVLGIERETLAALLVLRDAFEQRIAPVALLEEVTARLVRMEREVGV